MSFGGTGTDTMLMITLPSITEIGMLPVKRGA
jgi:hypothetical protein